MKYISYDKKEKKQKILNKYPRKEISEPLTGAGDIQMYAVIENIPVYDASESYLSVGEIELTTEIYEGNEHILIANQLYEVINYTSEDVINKLNESLGTHLDENYPIWERVKHAGEGNYILLSMIDGKLTKEQSDRKKYIDDVYDWITKCRADRDVRELDYIEKNKFPSFEWDVRPNN